jgi:hypothetical protein
VALQYLPMLPFAWKLRAAATGSETGHVRAHVSRQIFQCLKWATSGRARTLR